MARIIRVVFIVGKHTQTMKKQFLIPPKNNLIRIWRKKERKKKAWSFQDTFIENGIRGQRSKFGRKQNSFVRDFLTHFAESVEPIFSTLNTCWSCFAHHIISSCHGCSVLSYIRNKIFLHLPIRNACVTPPWFWNGVDWRLLVELHIPDFFLQRTFS